LSVVSKIDEILQSDIVQVDLHPAAPYGMRLRQRNFGSRTQVDGDLF